MFHPKQLRKSGLLCGAKAGGKPASVGSAELREGVKRYGPTIEGAIIAKHPTPLPVSAESRGAG